MSKAKDVQQYPGVLTHVVDFAEQARLIGTASKSQSSKFVVPVSYNKNILSKKDCKDCAGYAGCETHGFPNPSSTGEYPLPTPLSAIPHKKKKALSDLFLFVRDSGVEPLTTVWKTVILPIN
jgi:hypothetical protein